jgi:serine protease SohB
LEYLIEYGLFLAKLVTLVIAFVFVLTVIVSAGSKNRKGGERGHIAITHLNEELDEMRESMKKAIYDKASYKYEQKQEKKRQKLEERERKQQLKLAAAASEDLEDNARKRVYVVDFNGDIEASDVGSLREEITAILSLATPRDEVLLRLESPGGMVHAYGLASAQLERIKSQQVSLTICVDKVAASGGYMMACLADRLVAAPFAILGSIGVLVQLPNFNRLLRKHEVDYETISAGEFKTTLTTFGEITQKGRDKVKEDVEEMHVLFKSWVKDHRPSVNIDNIATGETWVGLQALEKSMVDELMTSDECIVKACEDADVYEVRFEIRRTLGDKIGAAIYKTADRTVLAWIKRARESSFYS